MPLFEKYRTFFIIGTAEGIGLILTKPKDVSLFFLTWAFLILIMIAYSLLQWRFEKPEPKKVSTLTDGLDQTVETIADQSKLSLTEVLSTKKNKTYGLLLVLNVLLYLIFSFVY